MDLKAKLTEIAAASLLRDDQFLVDVVASSKNLSKITVVVDGDRGVTIDDCTQISRNMSDRLENMAFGTLEVTTPGVDQPLRMPRQYKKNAGRRLRIHASDKTVTEGRLVAADDQGIDLLTARKEGKQNVEVPIHFNYNQIEKALVLISFK